MAPLQIGINAKSKKELDKIISQLLGQKLIACADIFPVESNYWWKGSIVEEKRWQAMAFTSERKKETIIEAIEKMHSDEVPGIIFSAVETNKKYFDWIVKVLE